jgi:hypothetical protein
MIPREETWMHTALHWEKPGVFSNCGEFFRSMVDTDIKVKIMRYRLRANEKLVKRKTSRCHIKLQQQIKLLYYNPQVACARTHARTHTHTHMYVQCYR